MVDSIAKVSLQKKLSGKKSHVKCYKASKEKENQTQKNNSSIWFDEDEDWEICWKCGKHKITPYQQYILQQNRAAAKPNPKFVIKDRQM